MAQAYSYQVAGTGASEPLSVTAALNLTKQALESISLSIVGEISDLSDNPRYKAVYFTIADEGAALPCLMWRSSFDRLGLQLRSGMQIEVRGRFSLYAAKGRMQFDVKELSLAGEGRLRAQVAALAAKLRSQGLMDESRKLPIPLMSERIALVTSPRGKAVHDVLRTLRRRFPLAKVLLYGVGVEGKDAANGIIQALEAADSSEADVILLVRGGGSYEDLMLFNDEALALTISRLKKPIVTGIGHEPDTSIADMVASLRASTPTAAAEAVVPNTQELYANLHAREASLVSGLKRYLERSRHVVDSFRRLAVFSQDRFLIGHLELNLEQTAERLDRAIPTGFKTARNTVGELQQRLKQAGRTLSGSSKVQLAQAEQNLVHLGTAYTNTYERELAIAAASLENLSPLAVLSRGYALGYDAQGKILQTTHQVKIGDTIRVRLSDGSLAAKVLELEPKPATQEGKP